MARRNPHATLAWLRGGAGPMADRRSPRGGDGRRLANEVMALNARIRGYRDLAKHLAELAEKRADEGDMESVRYFRDESAANYARADELESMEDEVLEDWSGASVTEEGEEDLAQEIEEEL